MEEVVCGGTSVRRNYCTEEVVYGETSVWRK